MVSARCSSFDCSFSVGWRIAKISRYCFDLGEGVEDAAWVHGLVEDSLSCFLWFSWYGFPPGMMVHRKRRGTVSW